MSKAKSYDGGCFCGAVQLTDVYAAVIPSFPFKPGVHVHYQETVLRMKDGLPKLQDVPKEMGGSGDAIPE